MMVWEEGDPEMVRREVLRKPSSAKGGGLIFQSDHSMSGRVSGNTHDPSSSSSATTASIRSAPFAF